MARMKTSKSTSEPSAGTSAHNKSPTNASEDESVLDEVPTPRRVPKRKNDDIMEYLSKKNEKELDLQRQRLELEKEKLAHERAEREMKERMFQLEKEERRAFLEILKAQMNK